jgi:tetratricopeptide (TPR) repeat protein
VEAPSAALWQGSFIGASDSDEDIRRHVAKVSQEAWPTRLQSGSVVVGDIPQEPMAFQERPDLLDALINSKGQQPIVVFAVTGLRGVGKSQLAAACARRRLAEHWRVVAWIDSEERAQLLAGFDQLAGELGLRVDGQDSYESAKRVRHWLEGDGARCMLVLDNATSAEMLRPFVPAAGSAQVIVTSSHRSLASLGTQVPIDVFELNQSIAFLHQRTGQLDQEGAARVSEELGNLPLALAQAASVIAGQRLDYATYLSRLATIPVAKYLSRTEEDPYPRGTAEAIILSLTAGERNDPGGLGRQLLERACVLSAAGVSRTLLADAIGVEQADVDAALQILADASLVTWSLDSSSVAAHRLVMRVVRERALHDATLYKAIRNAVRGLQAQLERQEELRQYPAKAKELVRQIIALAEQVTSFPGAIDDQHILALVKLRTWVGWYLNEIADTSHAIPLLEQNFAECERIFGRAQPDTLTACDNLATAYRLAGRLREAIELQVRNLADRERVLGEEHPDTLLSRRNLGRTYRVAGRVDKAITLLVQNLSDCQRLLGKEHPESLAALNHLARAYRAAGRVDEALPLLEQNVASRQRILGDDHIDTLTSRNNLADAYRVIGRLDEALRLLKQNLADRQRVLGDDHPDTLTARNNLAAAFEAAGDLRKAIRLYEENLAERRRILGPHHPDTLTSVDNLAVAYRNNGLLDEAITLWQQDLADCIRLLSPDHPLTWTVLTNLQQAAQTAK